MNSSMAVSVCIFIFSVFISSVSQIILKKGAGKQYESRLKEYMNPYVLSAYFIFFFSSLITVYSYKKVPLSAGPVIEASGYIFVSVLGRVLLKEKISRRRLAGLFMIVLGIVIVFLGG
ncbi:MAG: multidrug ABC transporter [Ruminococcus sp.]|nr:multidrug ABC transporter [Ruminococcus sp.]